MTRLLVEALAVGLAVLAVGFLVGELLLRLALRG